MRAVLVISAIAVSLLSIPPADSARSGVTLLRLPEGGIQPQAVVGRDGAIHALFYRGKPGAGDLYYTTVGRSGAYSEPIRINSQPGSAVAAGTIRGGQLAMGRKGIVHVVWNGSGVGGPKPPLGGMPMLYSRLVDGKFEPQRNLMQKTGVLDGGGTVAADLAGNVYALWHGNDSPSGSEADRRLWMVRSSDDGQSFGPESAANPEPTGACACCSVRAFSAADGTLFALYRQASETVNRDMVLLVSKDGGARFRGRAIHPWKVPT